MALLKNQDQLVENRKKEIQSLLNFLEDEYRAAKISEQSYNELKQQNLKKLEELDKKLGKSPEKTESIDGKSKDFIEEKEEVENFSEVPETDVQKDSKIDDKKESLFEKPQKTLSSGENISVSSAMENPQQKGGISLFRKIFKRKEISQKPSEEQVEKEEGPVFIDPLKGPPEEKDTEEKTSASTTISLVGGDSAVSMEIEKIKLLIDTIKEKNKATDERLATISENLGEMRSLVFQADGNLREALMKLEGLEDQVAMLKPKEIEKRFKETDAKIEKHEMGLEMNSKKIEDLITKANQTYSMLKDIGSIENLASINKEIGKKLEEIKELTRYLERISSKTEKYYLDTTKNMEDFLHYKIKVDNFEEISKELVKSVDVLGLKFENYISKTEMNTFKEDLLSIQKQIEELNKILPLAEMNMPPEISKLKNEKDDIKLFLDSIENEHALGKISDKEYKKIKKKNEKRLDEIEKKIIIEWKKFESFLNSSKKTPSVISEKKTEELDLQPPPEKSTIIAEDKKPKIQESLNSEDSGSVEPHETLKAESVISKITSKPSLEEKIQHIGGKKINTKTLKKSGDRHLSKISRKKIRKKKTPIKEVKTYYIHQKPKKPKKSKTRNISKKSSTKRKTSKSYKTKRFIPKKTFRYKK